MKTLMILRHAKSSWKEPDMSDHDRPLNKRGEHDAPRVGQLIKAENVVPELIVSSTALRAATTARAVAEAAGYTDEIVFESSLYLASPRTCIEHISILPSEINRAMFVAHNPGLQELVYLMSNEDMAFPTAALAVIEWETESWDDVVDRLREGRLAHYWIPKELD